MSNFEFDGRTNLTDLSSNGAWRFIIDNAGTNFANAFLNVQIAERDEGVAHLESSAYIQTCLLGLIVALFVVSVSYFHILLKRVAVERVQLFSIFLRTPRNVVIKMASSSVHISFDSDDEDADSEDEDGDDDEDWNQRLMMMEQQRKQQEQQRDAHQQAQAQEAAAAAAGGGAGTPSNMQMVAVQINPGNGGLSSPTSAGYLQAAGLPRQGSVDPIPQTPGGFKPALRSGRGGVFGILRAQNTATMGGGDSARGQIPALPSAGSGEPLHVGAGGSGAVDHASADALGHEAPAVPMARGPRRRLEARGAASMHFLLPLLLWGITTIAGALLAQLAATDMTSA